MLSRWLAHPRPVRLRKSNPLGCATQCPPLLLPTRSRRQDLCPLWASQYATIGIPHPFVAAICLDNAWRCGIPQSFCVPPLLSGFTLRHSVFSVYMGITRYSNAHKTGLFPPIVRNPMLAVQTCTSFINEGSRQRSNQLQGSMRNEKGDRPCKKLIKARAGPRGRECFKSTPHIIPYFRSAWRTNRQILGSVRPIIHFSQNHSTTCT